MVQSVILDGPNYKHYIYTQDGELQLIDSGTDGTFATDIDDTDSALTIAGKVVGSSAGEMDVAAALIYDSALSAGADDLGGDHAVVSQYLYSKYLSTATGGNTDPVAVDDPAIGDETSFITDEDTSFTTGNVLANDSDVDGDDLAVDTFDAISSAGGLVSYNDNGTFSYDPNGQFEALDEGGIATDSFTYTVSDGNGGTANATVNISINGVTDEVLNPCDLITGGLVLWLESDDVGVSETDVVTWNDQSLQENNLAASGDPQLVNVDGPNNMPFISLDGTGDFLDRTENISGLPSGANARTIFTVVRYVNMTTFAGVSYGNPAANQAFGPVVNGSGGLLTLQGYGGGNDIVSSFPGTGAGWLSQSVVLEENGDYKHYKDGNEILAGNRAYETVVSRISIGGEIGFAGNGETMDVAAVLFYDRALSEQERQQVENYLQQKYFGLASPCGPNGCAITNVAAPNDALCNETTAEFTVTFDVEGGSGDYNVVDVDTGNILASITNAELTGTGLSIEVSLENSTTESVINIDVVDANDQLCLGNVTKTVNLPACSIAAVTYTLTTNSENGSIQQDPVGPIYEENTSVTLTAVPDSGYEFVEWSGDASGNENPLIVNMDNDKSITASFTLVTNAPCDLVTAGLVLQLGSK